MDGRVTQVLLVGVETARLEVEFLPYDLSCHLVVDAQLAVDCLRQGQASHQPWQTVVVAQHLPDMTGPGFVDGLVRHFQPATVVLLADLEPHMALLLAAMPNVAVVPGATAGAAIAEHLIRRMGGAWPAKPAPTLASLFDAPRTGGAPTAPLFPQPMPIMPVMPVMPVMPAPAPTFAARASTMPFFQALNATAPTVMPVASSSPVPELVTPAQLEELVTELAGANAELVSLRARLQDAEGRVLEVAQQVRDRELEHVAVLDEARDLQTELDMVRQAVASEAAERRAVADTSTAPLAVVEFLRHALQEASSHADMEKAERAAFAQSSEDMRRQLVAELKATQARVTALNEAQLAWQAEGLVTQSLVDSARQRSLAVESANRQLLAELELAHLALGEAAGLRADLELVRNDLLQSAADRSREQQTMADLQGRLGEAEAAHQHSAQGQEAELGTLRRMVEELAPMAAAVGELQGQLHEAVGNAKLEAARADRAVGDAAAMRQFIEAQTYEQARVVGELEQLRPIAAEVDRSRAAMVDMQRQLEAALGTDELEGSTEGAIEEGVRARTRELFELARAIEPFGWGLDQAAAFFAEVGVEGAPRHVQALQLLQKTMERLKGELDRLHQN